DCGAIVLSKHVGEVYMIQVLYIEDNSLNRRLVKKYLHNIGLEMLEAIDGYSGVNIAKLEMPKLVLVDVNLPEIDGFEVLKLLRQETAFATIPLIALTANAMHGDRERCLDAGFDAYLAKPISRHELITALRNHLPELAT